MRTVLTCIVVLALTGPAAAQTGATYKLEEHTLNAAGHPDGGSLMTGASHQITLDAVGDGVAAYGLTGSTYSMDAGFGAAYAPPGAVSGLVFTTKTDLEWAPEGSPGDYNLYRDLMSSLSGLGYGACEQQGISGTTTTDSDAVPASDGFFYLVTALNTLSEEGTKGFQASGGTPGAERTGAMCP
jgi:hypothetical protein